MDYCDIVVYCGYGQMDPMWSLLLLLRPWMSYGYIVIHVVYWVELPEQRRLCSIFVKLWIPINGTEQCDIGLSKIHKNSMSCRVVNRTLGFWFFFLPSLPPSSLPCTILFSTLSSILLFSYSPHYIWKPNLDSFILFYF